MENKDNGTKRPIVVQASKEIMEHYANSIEAKHTDGDIFLLTRNIQDGVLAQYNQIITNLSNLYWFLIDKRDSLKKDNANLVQALSKSSKTS
jgi:hypothetical protein